MARTAEPPASPSAPCDAPVERGKRDGSDPWCMGWAADEHWRLEILGDSKVLVSWVCGAWEVKRCEHAKMVREIVDQFVRWHLGGTFRPRTEEADWCRHIFREHNKAADLQANWLNDHGDRAPGAQSETHELRGRLRDARGVVLSFDGARRGCGTGAAAWVLRVRDETGSFEKVGHGFGC